MDPSLICRKFTSYLSITDHVITAVCFHVWIFIKKYIKIFSSINTKKGTLLHIAIKKEMRVCPQESYDATKNDNIHECL